MSTYRAAYLPTLALTTEEHAHLSDADLLAVAADTLAELAEMCAAIGEPAPTMADVQIGAWCDGYMS